MKRLTDSESRAGHESVSDHLILRDPHEAGTANFPNPATAREPASSLAYLLSQARPSLPTPALRLSPIQPTQA